ncbi:MAG: hypothetical protein EOL87_12615 [Spartobacteria bacterium]|nr:hypothetical protein [Spartobacteria bacterium]
MRENTMQSRPGLIFLGIPKSKKVPTIGSFSNKSSNHWKSCRKKFQSLKLFITLFAVLSAPIETAWAWDAPVHYLINLRAAQYDAPLMKNWSSYEKPLAGMAHLPDVWKGSDKAEGVRHYIDMEYYGGPNKNIERAMEGVYDPSTKKVSTSEGIVPWVIMHNMDDLSDAMRRGDWVLAERIAAAMGHYVGDLHMPLHTTANYNGQDTGNYGIHARWESIMQQTLKKYVKLPSHRPIYIDAPWRQLTQWIIKANDCVPSILKADDFAREAAHGDIESRRYYKHLWKRTEPIFISQISAAAAHLSDLWYTAWVNAGKPVIPKAASSFPKTSIHQETVTSNPHRSLLTTSNVFLAIIAISAGRFMLRRRR